MHVVRGMHDITYSHYILAISPACSPKKFIGFKGWSECDLESHKELSIASQIIHALTVSDIISTSWNIDNKHYGL